jgi:ribosome biogenesis GTPase
VASRPRRERGASRRRARAEASGIVRSGVEDGIVVAHFGVAVAVRMTDGRRVRFPVRRDSSYVVGDRVRVEESRLEVIPADGLLCRRDSHGRVRSVAANLDVLGIVLATLPESPVGFVDRAVVAARAAGIEPFHVLNKCDLEGAELLRDEIVRIHAGIEHVFVVSAVRGDGLDALRAFFATGVRGAFVGTSGVGKSSILNALCPDLDLRVGEINQWSGLGRHVTTNATLHALPDGGELVDTPGFRDFGPVEVSSPELASYFPGFESALDEGCRFRDCLHRSEPGCEVRAADVAGRLPAGRHAAYLDLLAELEAVEKAARRF